MTFTHESLVSFFSVGVQLLPVFWLVLAVETSWLKATLRQQKRPVRRALASNVMAFSFLLGAFAECFALLLLMGGGWPLIAEFGIAMMLFFALGYSVIAAAVAMLRVVLAVEDADPPSVRTPTS
jgi:hypothetical protein